MRELCPSFLQQAGLTSFVRRIASRENVFFYCLVAFSYVFLRIYPTVLKPLFRHRTASATGARSGRCYSSKVSKKSLVGAFNQALAKEHTESFSLTHKPTGATFSRSPFTGKFRFFGEFRVGSMSTRARPQTPEGNPGVGWMGCFIYRLTMGRCTNCSDCGWLL